MLLMCTKILNEEHNKAINVFDLTQKLKKGGLGIVLPIFTCK